MVSHAFALLLGLCVSDAFRNVRDGHNVSVEAGWRPVLLPGQIDVKRPAFLMMDDIKEQVVISQFGKLKKRGKWGLNPLPAQSTITTISLDMLSDLKKSGRFAGNLGTNDLYISDSQLQWPNKLSRAPSSFGDYIVIPDGFLPPGKSDGNIYLADSEGGLFRITPAEKGACYHEVEFHDFNGDGLEDILTARFVKSGPFFKPTFKGDLLWYENPGKSKLTSEWKQHIIAKGPDVIFKKIPYGRGYAIFCAEFFNERLTVQFVSQRGEFMSSRVIDENIGKAFGVSVEDVDGDGKAELLVTNHQADAEDDIKSGIFAYEIPRDLKNGMFKKHTLAQGISPLKIDDAGAGAPGFAHSFYPRRNMRGPKHIIAAGDGTFDVWYLTPTNTRFEYNYTLVDIGGTTGKMLLNDFDNDGIMDVLVPDNDQWKLKMITFTQ